MNGGSSNAIKNLGWRVTLAGVGINLALGILYTWSVISRGVPDEWGWSQSDKSWPYAVACLVFCLLLDKKRSHARFGSAQVGKRRCAPDVVL